jgi:tryptophan halogenase
LDKVLYSNILAYGNKVDVNNASWALQFDAIRVAKYLTDIALSRGIKVLEGTYSHTIDTSEGFISKISLEGGRTLSTDFVFDCSGFARLLIGKKFKQPWDSYSKFLPAKEAIPFRLPVEKPLTPYTKAIAMKYGWMWSIPLQDMTGCGYTYDTDYINAAEAQKEVEEFLGIPITPIKVINFETGQYRKVWVKNCLAIGLSTGFAEPLESTSVHMSISQLEDLKHFLNHIFTYNEESQESYNKNNYEQNRAVLDFIYLHYLTVRKDTPFWRDFRANHPTPPSFKHLLKLIEERNLRFFDINRDLIWKLSNYLQVSEGLELPTKPINIEGYTNLIPSLEDRTGLFNRFYKDAEDHAKFMNNLLGTPNT